MMDNLPVGTKVQWRKPGQPWRDGTVVEHPVAGASTAGVWVKADEFDKLQFVYGRFVKEAS